MNLKSIVETSIYVLVILLSLIVMALVLTSPAYVFDTKVIYGGF